MALSGSVYIDLTGKIRCAHVQISDVRITLCRSKNASLRGTKQSPLCQSTLYGLEIASYLSNDGVKYRCRELVARGVTRLQLSAESKLKAYQMQLRLNRREQE
jgi:hypothetical protein